MGMPMGTLKFQNLNSALWWYLGPTHWRYELTPYSQRAHLNISPWGEFTGDQHTVSSQETKSRWAHRGPNHSELTGDQLTASLLLGQVTIASQFSYDFYNSKKLRQLIQPNFSALTDFSWNATFSFNFQENTNRTFPLFDILWSKLTIFASDHCLATFVQ